ncbi:MAG: AAA family ATPase [Bacteroidota bacterium]
MAENLPLGLQDFRKIIENDFLYIDKTAYLYRMVSRPGAYFLSRPRRFGKSLTVSTLNELYKGSRELFKGLWIEDKWDWSRKHPVIKVTLTGSGFVETGLEAALHNLLDKQIRERGFPPGQGSVSNKFEYLIQESARDGKVVVLIDEYDAPIIHYLGRDIDKAVGNREILREFYTVLKNNDSFLELVFLTGVSKSGMTGIFSGLNNLTDLSMHPRYATMLGYTQDELEHYFDENVTATALQMKLTREALLEQLRVWYNGYRFEEEADRVYNPVSVNHFFNTGKFQNFWFATGTPTFLINLLRKEGIYELHFPPLNPAGFETFELDRLKVEAILFQTGYLTIQSRDEDGLLILDYPNKEVRDSMLENLIEGFVGVNTERSASLVISLRKAFFADDLEQVFRILQTVFTNIPYQLQDKHPEKFYHAAIHLLFTYMGLRAHSEVCTSDGRVDSMVETPTRFYILEFKLDRSAGEALEQIKQKKYYRSVWESGKPVTCVGVNFSSETRNIEGWIAG